MKINTGMFAGIVLALSLTAAGAAAADGEWRQYETPHYSIHTDLGEAVVREAVVRTNAMAEVYVNRTRGFSGATRRRLPLYLFSKAADYHKAGGLKGSAGVYTGDKLMALADDGGGAETWRVIQHEGFHQFLHNVVKSDVPPWVDEGLAEYFSHAIFTGDGFVTGAIPPQRLRDIQKLLRDGTFLPLKEMMAIGDKAWNQGLSVRNYDQAWSMIYYLHHAEGGKFQRPFDAYMNMLIKGMPAERAWTTAFGNDIKGFEAHWREYWQKMPENPTRDVYARAVTSILTSFLARSHAQRQQFEDFAAFRKAGEAGQLKADPRDWLPPQLLKDALTAARSEAWSLEDVPDRPPRIAFELDDKRRAVGRFELKSGRIVKVDVQIEAVRTETVVATATRPSTPEHPLLLPTSRPANDPMAAALSLARSYQANGQPQKAADILRRSLRDHPTSPLAAEADKMLKGL